MNKNAKDIINYLKKKDNDVMDSYDGYCENEVNAIVKYYYYEQLDWCGCGEPNKAIEIVEKLLDVMSEREFDDRHKKLKEYFDVDYVYDNPLLLCLAYTMDAAKFTDHGSSIGWAWLTEDGENFLWAIKYGTEHDLIDL